MISLKRNERGFVLPLTIILVVVLGISGMGFLHLDYLEQLSTLNEASNFSGFYLANAGIERARESFKIPDTLSWTDVLNGTYDGPDADTAIDYPVDDDPATPPILSPTILCPDAQNRGCVVPAFQSNAKNTTIGTDGDAVDSPDFPFSGTFDAGQYNVRAFNNIEGGVASKTDNDQKLVFRALGNVRGEQKLIEVTVQAASGLNLINCITGQPCPEKADGQATSCTPDTNPSCFPSDGKEPASGPLPTLKVNLSDTTNYYRFDLNTSNFGTFIVKTCASPGIDCPNNGKISIDAEDNTFYFFNKAGAEITVNSVQDRNRVVVYNLAGSQGSIILSSNKEFTNSILIGQGEVQLKGGGIIHAPLPRPAVIAEGNVNQGNATTAIYGAIYATGKIDANPLDAHGVLIGSNVEIQGTSTYTDDNNPAYYELMPGFNYPDDLKTTVTVANSWKEIE